MRPSAMGDLVAVEGICVGKWVVVPFALLGTDEHGQLQTKQMIPLTSASRFRCGMQWVHVAMAAVGYGKGKWGGLRRTHVVLPRSG